MSPRSKSRKPYYIQKVSGEQQSFSERKLVRSLRDAGASRAQARHVAELMRERDGPPLNTQQLYRIALSLLRKESPNLAARYSLKRALLSLGPSGFPFERLVGNLLELEGYQVAFNQVLKGHCISHEVDVVATMPKKRILIECKYHSDPKKKNDVKVALYVQARAQDLISGSSQHRVQEFWLVSNTRFTREAINYAACSGLTLLGWDYPLREGLRDKITRSGMHPITCLTRLNKMEKRLLLDRNVVSSRELLRQPELLEKIGRGEDHVRRVIEEVEALVRQP